MPACSTATTVVDGTNHCYGLAFVVLAYAHGLLAGIEEARGWLSEAWESLETHFWREADGLYVDEISADWQTVAPYRGQNANMHACEAAVGLAMPLAQVPQAMTGRIQVGRIAIVPVGHGEIEDEAGTGDQMAGLAVVDRAVVLEEVIEAALGVDTAGMVERQGVADVFQQGVATTKIRGSPSGFLGGYCCCGKAI